MCIYIYIYTFIYVYTASAHSKKLGALEERPNRSLAAGLADA